MRRLVVVFVSLVFVVGPVLSIGVAATPDPSGEPQPMATGTLFRFQIHQLIEIDPLDIGTAPDFYIRAYVDYDLAISVGPFVDQPRPIVDEYYSKSTTNQSVRISMFLFDEDQFDPFGDDLADISGYVGGGAPDYSTIPAGAWFLGYYNLTTGTWDSGSDPLVRSDGWWMTSGELDGSTTTNEQDAAVLFDVSGGTPASISSVSPDTDVTMEAWSNTTFAITVDDPDSTISYDWVYDGYVNELNTSTVLLSVTGTDIGRHTLQARVFEDGSSRVSTSYTWSIQVTPYNRPPEGRAGPDRTVTVLETIEFDGSNSYDPDGWNLSLWWDFGDGSVASGEIVYHLYVEPGVYTVALNVSDGNKTTTDVALITVVDHPIINAQSSPTISLFGTDAFNEPLAFETVLNSSKSWRINVYENDEYRLFLKFQLVFEYRVKHTGSTTFSSSTTVSGDGSLSTNVTLVNSTDTTVVEFRPEVRITFSKEIKSNQSVKTYIDLRFGFPSQTDLDGDGSGVYVGTTKIFLFDQFVEIYNSSGSNQIGILHSVERLFTLYRIDILELLQEIAPQGTFLWEVLDFLINIYLDFDLNVATDFRPLIYLVEVDPVAGTTDYAPMGFDQSGSWLALSYRSNHTRDSRYFVLGQVLSSTATWGSLDLNVTLTWAGDLLADAWNFLTGWDGDREWLYPLLRTETLHGSSYEVSLQPGVVEAWYEPPPTVTGISTTVLAPSTAAVSWTGATQESVDHYGWRLERQGGGVPGVGEGNVDQQGSPGLTFENLEEGTGFRLRLWTVNLDGEAGPVATYDFATPLSEPVLEITDVGESAVTARWTPPRQAASLVYTLRVVDVETQEQAASQVVLGRATTEATVEGLKAGHEYQLVLEASTDWASANSSALQFTTTIPPPPDAPAALGIAGTATDGVTVNWTSSQDPQVVAYLVVVLDAATSEEVLRVTVQGRAADAQTLQGLEPDHEYRVLVYSVDEFNQQGNPTTIDVRTAAVPAQGGLPGLETGGIVVAMVGASLLIRRGRRSKLSRKHGRDEPRKPRSEQR